MSPLSSNDINRCLDHCDRLARIEERIDALEAKSSSKMDQLKFIVSLVFAFLGSGSGLYILGRLMGGK